jgi:glutamine phosphoribosylpyrophosphate amidotransferase
MKTLLASGALLGGFYLTQKKKTECCGIIGILSEKRTNIAPSLSLGVELLKNRGYDSAGIVTFATKDGKVQ